jgi:hypothetical protein
MICLQRKKTSFWGKDYYIHPMLLSEVFGDGKEVIWFEYMDDRPCFYVIRVNTGTYKQIESKADEFYDELLPVIEDAIDDEAVDFYSDRNWRERDKLGYVYDSRRWPIPPYYSSGSSWGKYTGVLLLPGGKPLPPAKRRAKR